MSDDYYQILGVSRGASQDEIARAYRKMARKYHPDVNPDDVSAKQRFQKVQGAFDVLSDPDKKNRYDQFGENFESFEGAGASQFGGMDLEQIFGGGAGGVDLETLLRQFGGPQHAGPPRQGANRQDEIEVSFHTAVLGGDKQILVPGNTETPERINVKVPAGIENGKKIRVAGKGELSPGGGPPGDLLLKVRVAEHPCFRRRGLDLELDLPLTVAEAIRGAAIDLPTPYGVITLKVPPGTSGGSRLRVKDHGIRGVHSSGHLYAVAQIHVPQDVSGLEDGMLENLESCYPENPRDGIRWE